MANEAVRRDRRRYSFARGSDRTARSEVTELPRNREDVIESADGGAIQGVSQPFFRSLQRAIQRVRELLLLGIE